jgi:hypothetical protein
MRWTNFPVLTMLCVSALSGFLQQVMRFIGSVTAISPLTVLFDFYRRAALAMLPLYTPAPDARAVP